MIEQKAIIERIRSTADHRVTQKISVQDMGYMLVLSYGHAHQRASDVEEDKATRDSMQCERVRRLPYKQSEIVMNNSRHFNKQHSKIFQWLIIADSNTY